MPLEDLRRQTCACLALRYPEIDEPARLVDECFANAQQSFRSEFMLRFRPETWAQITIVYFKHFLDTGIDVGIGEIFHAVVRDAVQTSRMDMLTLQLAQQKEAEQLTSPAASRAPILSIVRNDTPPEQG